MDKQPLPSVKTPVRCSHDQTCYRSNTFKSATDGILEQNSVRRKNTFSVVLRLQLCNFTQRVYYTIKQPTYFNKKGEKIEQQLNTLLWQHNLQTEKKMEQSIPSVALTNCVAIATRPTVAMPLLPVMKAH